ncbi:hypothetical protein EVAR_43599_1 [Eumeta japonica]|uniref:Uncharacterized protein n=1 Tax=Eumeta variegata TaxID=151549 RepID=A0A4C1XFB2_EUMVA|nr:hypothetical protein EVAR_43599_1 [Eumeta japonica]
MLSKNSSSLASPVRVVFNKFRHIDKLVSWPTRLQHKNGLARPVKCHTFTEYGLEVAASAVVFRSVSASSDGPFTLSPYNQPGPLDILFLSKRLATN